MRTTVTLDPDVQAAIDRLRRDEGIGLSEAVNRLARGGLVGSTESRSGRGRFVQRTSDLGLRIDISSVADALELLEGPDHR